jgi:hypothetical protein
MANPLNFQHSLTIFKVRRVGFDLDARQGAAILFIFWMRGAAKSYARVTHDNGVDGNKHLPS